MFNGLMVIGNKITINVLLHLSLHFLHILITLKDIYFLLPDNLENILHNQLYLLDVVL